MYNPMQISFVHPLGVLPSPTWWNSDFANLFQFPYCTSSLNWKSVNICHNLINLLIIRLMIIVIISDLESLHMNFAKYFPILLPATWIQWRCPVEIGKFGKLCRDAGTHSTPSEKRIFPLRCSHSLFLGQTAVVHCFVWTLFKMHWTLFWENKCLLALSQRLEFSWSPNPTYLHLDLEEKT